MYGRDSLQISKNMMDIDKNVKILFTSADSSVKEKVINMRAVEFLLKLFGIDQRDKKHIRALEYLCP